jgi:anti-sigma regulatory factor (Ser/Thr protein kinase)
MMNVTAELDKSPILDTTFDSGTLHVLRADVQAHASRAGFPDHRVEDMVLAIHELAANAVLHGAGAGRLRIWDLAGALHCQVDDGALASGDPVAPGAGHEDGEATQTESPPSPSALGSWWATPGHGLWVVQKIADQFRVTFGAHGTSAMVTFSPSPERR